MTSLIRQTFKTSRLSEFCSEKELVNRTGHAVEDWPLVILKELFDNALDGCEEAGTAPVIGVAINGGGITVTDNGPGMAAQTILDILDYSARRIEPRSLCIADARRSRQRLKDYPRHASPLDGDHGRVIIESRSITYTINFVTDRVRQEPRIDLTQEVSSVQIGTRITVEWPNSASRILADARPRIVPFVVNYAWINPHLTLSLEWGQDQSGQTNGPPRQRIRLGKNGGRPIPRRHIGMTFPGSPV